MAGLAQPCPLQLPPAVSGTFQGSLEARCTHCSLPGTSSPTAPDSEMLREQAGRLFGDPHSHSGLVT